MMIIELFLLFHIKMKYSLIGTTETRFFHPENPKIDDSEIDYLINSVNKYFIKQISRDDVVDTYSGIRPLIEDFKEASKVTRDYIFDLNKIINKLHYLIFMEES